MILDLIQATEANALIVADPDDTHYLGEADYMPSHCIATSERDAVAIFGPPTAQHFKGGPKATRAERVVLSKPLELTRLWQSQARRERNEPLSQFLSKALRYMRSLSPESDCVFSYADPARISPTTGEAHKGTIYRACNFECFGASRVTDEWEVRDPVTDEVMAVLSSPVCYRRFHTKSRQHLSHTAGYTCSHEKCETHQHVGPGLVLREKPPKILYVKGLRITPQQVREIIGGRYAES